MELRTLGYFVATADAGTVSAAAERVHVTQPSLSRQLRGLERELGVALFERGQRRLELSSAGRALLPRARALLDDAEALRRAARVHARGALERVTVAAPTTTLTDVVSPFLTTLAPDDPVPSVRETDGASAQEALRAGADLVIVAGRPPRPLASRALPPLPVWAYLPADHPWAGGDGVDGVRRVGLAALAEQPLVVLPTSHPARRVLDAALTTAGLDAPRLLEASNGTVAQALSAAGRGVAVVSDDPRFDLARVAVSLTGTGDDDDDDELRVLLHCAWDPRHPAAGVLAALATRISDFVLARYPS
ncbi:LysR family transcriptional regulator [Quadrisphaera setariae]|uniref:LysR family transcriptional regulator n=1 Tax=Quadrisphaera setariae TaxID=2593304 RepID=A0A5C8ZKH3_9ACTN|nr:LysR family transcriptional regulator [Quadrisphaera setariae]TXR58134.1 LysR family transcriptional regulator [Quadrisphaera setariae]